MAGTARGCAEGKVNSVTNLASLSHFFINNMGIYNTYSSGCIAVKSPDIGCKVLMLHLAHSRYPTTCLLKSFYCNIVSKQTLRWDQRCSRGKMREPKASQCNGSSQAGVVITLSCLNQWLPRQQLWIGQSFGVCRGEDESESQVGKLSVCAMDKQKRLVQRTSKDNFHNAAKVGLR